MTKSFLFPLPPSEDRDIALGQFMHQWGNLELQSFILFYILLGTTIEIANIIFATGFQSSKLSTLFVALGQIRLLESEQITLKKICKSYRELAENRNKIVHGAWYPEAIPGNPQLTQWARVYSPINPTTAKQIHEKDNEEVKNRYRFTIKELQKATDRIKTLTKDITKFTRLIMDRLYPDELP